MVVHPCSYLNAMQQLMMSLVAHVSTKDKSLFNFLVSPSVSFLWSVICERLFVSSKADVNEWFV